MMGGKAPAFTMYNIAVRAGMLSDASTVLSGERMVMYVYMYMYAVDINCLEWARIRLIC